MSYDISIVKGLLSNQSNPELKKASDISLGLIGMINSLFDGDFDSDIINLSEEDFFAVASCGFFMFETFNTVNLNGGYTKYAFSSDKHIIVDSVIPRSLFLMCYGSAIYDSEDDAKNFYIETNETFNELSNNIHNIYMNDREWGFLFDHLGISHLLISKEIKADFVNKMALLNGIASS